MPIVIELKDGLKRKFFQDDTQALVEIVATDQTVNTATGTAGTPNYDGGAAWISQFGINTGSGFTSSNVSGTATSVTDVPISGQKLVVTDVLVSVDTAMRIDLQEETTGIVISRIYLPANGTVQWTPRSKTKLSTANKRLQVKSNATGNVAITAHYYSEP